MTTFTVDPAILHSAAAEAYFTRADRRIRIGLRATLEMLGLPLPEYARRRPPGAAPAKAVAAAYQADHSMFRTVAIAPRKPTASPETIAAARQRSGFNPA